MGVELIENQTFVDLTGGADESTEENNDTTVEVSEQTVTGDEATSTETATEEQGDTSTSDSGEPDGDSSDSTDDSTQSVEEGGEAPEYFFGEQQVAVEVPTEISTALKEAGVDEKALLSQLFKKDGDFSIDEETRTKLEDKFGKLMVDGYLNMYKNLNEQTMSKIAADKEAAKATEAQQQTEYADAVGGIEGLQAMESFIVENFTDSEIAAYNAVMQTDEHAAHLLIISQVKARMELADKLTNGDKKISLVGDNTAVGSETASPVDKGFLDESEYRTITMTDKYWEDSEYQAKVDAARIAGKRKGL